MDIIFIALAALSVGSVVVAVERIIKKKRTDKFGGEPNSPIRENRLRNRRR